MGGGSERSYGMMWDERLCFWVMSWKGGVVAYEWFIECIFFMVGGQIVDPTFLVYPEISSSFLSLQSAEL